jgi:hypothetical protein
LNDPANRARVGDAAALIWEELARRADADG